MGGPALAPLTRMRNRFSADEVVRMKAGVILVFLFLASGSCFAETQSKARACAQAVSSAADESAWKTDRYGNLLPSELAVETSPFQFLKRLWQAKLPSQKAPLDAAYFVENFGEELRTLVTEGKLLEDQLRELDRRLYTLTDPVTKDEFYLLRTDRELSAAIDDSTPFRLFSMRPRSFVFRHERTALPATVGKIPVYDWKSSYVEQTTRTVPLGELAGIVDEATFLRSSGGKFRQTLWGTRGHESFSMSFLVEFVRVDDSTAARPTVGGPLKRSVKVGEPPPSL